ncbi:Mariner Mos1 transposase [Eumeta japonica]|uniref:Mariner Mos1 transposase n=1 Tax=Eumeta variegata TaxID=151549 RepID=A0A4C1SC17_EUMVA|nr:Mariner Mos1 transposase [Eumeta japonica]
MPQYYSRHDEIILLYDKAHLHVAVPENNYLKTLDWEVLPHPLYSPDIAPSNYLASKDKDFFRLRIRTLPERWKKVVASDGQYFD